jgi:hypothetical protein
LTNVVDAKINAPWRKKSARRRPFARARSDAFTTLLVEALFLA